MNIKGPWAYGLVEEHLFSMDITIGSIFSATYNSIQIL